MSHIARHPDGRPATSPDDPRYYDARDLEDELKRTFQICHECRMCVNFCGSFPALFDAVDRDIEGGRSEGAENVNGADMALVSDECWQCKLCYIKCPYTDDEDAAELLDFPRLMAREKANRAKRDGVAWVDQVLGEPQLIGAMGGGAMAPITNLIQRHQLLRKVQEKITGISAKFPLPPVAATSFPKWFEQRDKPLEVAPVQGLPTDVVLFATCYGNYNITSVPIAATKVLNHLGIRVHVVSETCCGMPNIDGGDVDGARKKIEANVDALLPMVEQGYPVLVGSPTCGYMMKREWAEYVPSEATEKVAAATQDLMQAIEGWRKLKLLAEVATEPLGKVAYHAPCHLRAQKIGFPAARVLTRLLPDTEVRIVQECSAVDGTWGMKAKHYETGRKYAKKLVSAVEDAPYDHMVSDCGLSAQRLTFETGSPVIHPIEALAISMGLEASPDPGAQSNLPGEA